MLVLWKAQDVSHVKHFVLWFMISLSPCRQLHTPTNLLLLSLASSDFLSGLVIIPLDVSRKTLCWFYGDFLCVMVDCLALTITSASTGNMVLISVDRYLAICYPLHYSTRVTLRKVQVCVCVCWLCSLVYSSVLIKDNLVQLSWLTSCYGECVYRIGYIPGAVDIAVTFIAPVTAIIALYGRVFVVALAHARAIRSHVVTVQLPVGAKISKSELKAAMGLGAVVTIFLTCFCPYYCISLMSSFKENVPEYLAFIFVVLNPCLNPVIYAFIYPWFRRAGQLIVTLQMLRPGSREINILRETH